MLPSSPPTADLCRQPPSPGCLYFQSKSAKLMSILTILQAFRASAQYQQILATLEFHRSSLHSVWFCRLPIRRNPTTERRLLKPQQWGEETFPPSRITKASIFYECESHQGLKACTARRRKSRDLLLTLTAAEDDRVLGKRFAVKRG